MQREALAERDLGRQPSVEVERERQQRDDPRRGRQADRGGALVDRTVDEVRVERRRRERAELDAGAPGLAGCDLTVVAEAAGDRRLRLAGLGLEPHRDLLPAAVLALELARGLESAHHRDAGAEAGTGDVQRAQAARQAVPGVGLDAHRLRPARVVADRVAHDHDAEPAVGRLQPLEGGAERRAPLVGRPTSRLVPLGLDEAAVAHQQLRVRAARNEPREHHQREQQHATPARPATRATRALNCEGVLARVTRCHEHGASLPGSLFGGARNRISPYRRNHPIGSGRRALRGDAVYPSSALEWPGCLHQFLRHLGTPLVRHRPREHVRDPARNSSRRLGTRRVRGGRGAGLFAAQSARRGPRARRRDAGRLHRRDAGDLALLLRRSRRSSSAWRARCA